MLELFNPKGDMYYTVGNDRFYNLMLAMQESKNTKQEIKFSYFDNILDSWDWTIDYTKTETWEDLLARRAREIRFEYKKVRIWYSGGRDSWLVLKSFIDNNVFIDEIAVIDFNYEGCEFPYIWQWLHQNKHLFHSNTKICKYQYNDKTFYKKLKQDWGENPNLSYMTPILNFYEIQNHIIGKYEPDGTAEVSGLEKPKVVIDKGFWSYISDPDVKLMIGAIEHVPFFISKNVPVFQYSTHYMVNYIKKFIQKNKITDFSKFNSQFFATVGWYRNEKGCMVQASDKDEDAQKIVNPYYTYFCEASLRTEYAADYLGSPHIKLQSNSSGAKRIGTSQWKEIEEAMQRYYPEQYNQLKHGVQLGHTGYNEYFSEDDPDLIPKPIKSKLRKVG